MNASLALSVIAIVGVAVLALTAVSFSWEIRLLKQQVVSLRKLSGIDAKLLDMDTRAEVLQSLPMGAGGALVLVIDDACSICEEVVPLFKEIAVTTRPDVAAAIVSRQPTKFAETNGAVAHLADRRIHHHLDPGYLPALHFIMTNGEPALTEPVGSRHGLTEAVALSGATAGR